MSINLQTFVNKQSKLVTKKSTKRVAKLDLTGKKNRGVVKLHIVPDTNGLPMLTTRNVYEVHETETYTYQDEVRTRYPNYMIPKSDNYNIVDGAVMPTDMQIKKLDKLTDLLDAYGMVSNKWQEGGPKLDKDETETKLWTKKVSTYTKFWAKLAEFTPSSSDAKQPDLSNLIMVTHSSANFVKAFNKWATPDSDSEVSVEDQLKKIEDAISDEPGQECRCIKIETVKGPIGYDVEIKNLKLENASIELTDEDLKEATPLITEDWDYTVFDDNKVDGLISKVETYLKNAGFDYKKVLKGSTESSDNDEESETEDEKVENPFSDNDE